MTTTETTIWEGRPSQWTNAGWFAACILVLPIPVALWKFLTVRCTQWTVTNQRLRMSTGVLNKKFDDLELYRVKDITVEQPFIQRLVGLGTIKLITSDATTPELRLSAIPEPRAVQDTLRAEVERARRERGVRELDVHDEDPSHRL